MSKPITIGNFDYSQDEKGEWIYKASESKPLKSGEAKYQEKPAFPLQIKIESSSKNKIAQILKQSVIEISKHIKNTLS